MLPAAGEAGGDDHSPERKRGCACRGASSELPLPTGVQQPAEPTLTSPSPTLTSPPPTLTSPPPPQPPPPPPPQPHHDWAGAAAAVGTAIPASIAAMLTVLLLYGMVRAPLAYTTAVHTRSS